MTLTAEFPHIISSLQNLPVWEERQLSLKCSAPDICNVGAGLGAHTGVRGPTSLCHVVLPPLRPHLAPFPLLDPHAQASINFMPSDTSCLWVSELSPPTTNGWLTAHYPSMCSWDGPSSRKLSLSRQSQLSLLPDSIPPYCYGLQAPWVREVLFYDLFCLACGRVMTRESEITR